MKTGIVRFLVLSGVPYTITTDKARIDVGAVHAMLAATYWSPRVRRDVVERAIANSIIAAALDGATRLPVGFARVVTDRATFAWLCDVIVLPEHRGAGLSVRMIGALESLPELQNLRRWCLATRDAHGLYEKFGFVPARPGAWMERKAPDSAWQTPE